MAYPVHAVTLPADLVGAVNGKLTTQLARTFFEGRGLLQAHTQLCRAWSALFSACWFEQSVVLTSSSAADVYRTYEQQVSVFLQRYTTVPVPGTTSTKFWNGRTYYLKRGLAMVATPGTSNHGLGLAMDLCEIRNGKDLIGIAGSPAWPWLLENAARFGLSWEAQSEPWHLRLFVGDTPTQAILDHEAGIKSPPVDEEPEPVHVPPTFDPIGAFPETVKPVIQLGAAGDLVLYLQVVIFYKAGDAIAMDGHFGALTEGRVKDLQGVFGLTVDGKVGTATWGVIDYLARN